MKRLMGVFLVVAFVFSLSVVAALAQESCEGNFDCDADCDGTDAVLFKDDFGRNTYTNECTTIQPCNGDFDCDGDCDGTDAVLFKDDFGRNQYSNPCPACVVSDWCTDEGIRYSIDFLEPGNPGGWTESLKTFDEEWNMLVGEEVEIDIWLNDAPLSLLSAGVWVDYDPDMMSIEGVDVYDGNDLPGPWDSGMTQKVVSPEGSGTYFVVCGNFANAIPDQYRDIVIAKFRLRCNLSSPQNMTFITLPNVDTVVDEEAHVYDLDIQAHTVTINPQQ